MNKNKKKKTHSYEWLGEYRDFFWNEDFLELMARRWRLNSASSMADIGSGLAHWSRLLFKYLKQPARLTGVDIEEEYVKDATAVFKKSYPEVTDDQIRFVRGDANKLQLNSDSFDVVTCQTLLIHLKDPRKALQEMVRIAKPGGIIICAEPSNIFENMEFSTITREQSPEEVVEKFEFLYRNERGRILNGQGDVSFGDILPGLFWEVGLEDIRVYMSDKPMPMFPPYSTKEQKALLSQWKAWKDGEEGFWNREKMSNNARLGGATEEFIKSQWEKFEKEYSRVWSAIEKSTYYTAGGSVTYLVSGRKVRTKIGT